MGHYTEYLDLQIETLEPTDDDYERKLREIAGNFRDFGTALTEFLTEHGYAGERDDTEAKVRFLREKYKQAGVDDLPRDFKKWFQPQETVKRKTVFPLVFALDLSLEETGDFFRRVMLERSFDCHTISEAIYYFCIKKRLPYSEAKRAIEQIPKMDKSAQIPDCEVLYTGTIVEFLDNADTIEEVTSYIKENQPGFQYNNATAIGFIRELWNRIKGENGLALQEGRILYTPCTSSGEKKKEKEDQEKEKAREEKKDNPVTSDANASSWIIYSQILGLDHFTESKYSDKRSLTPVFKDNVLLPLRASDSFPNRQSIDRILRGETGEHEVFRKMLIFLSFYSFCARKVVEKNDAFYPFEPEERERCLDQINRYLLDSGYPSLYAGNPYDWIFLWSLGGEEPLPTFRMYIGELFAVKSEE